MTSRQIQYTLSAQSNIDQVMASITGAVRTLGSQSASVVPRLATDLANAQAATTRAATATLEYQSALRGLATQAGQTQTALSHITQGSGGLGSLLSGAVAGVAQSATNAVLGGIKDLGGAILGTAGTALTLAGNAKQSALAFTTMLGSAAAARQELAAIRAYSDSTAFTFPQLQTVTAEFLGVGLGAKSALAQVRDLGDEVAGRGKSPEMLDRISLAMSQVISKGKLMGDDARQFQEAGLPVWQILATYLNTDAAAAQKLSEEGRITADVWQNALHADAVQNFAGAAERASDSWNGLLSTLSDTGTGLLTTFGSPIIQSLEPLLRGAIAVLKDPQVESTIQSWGTAIGSFIQQVTQGATLLAQLFGLQLPHYEERQKDQQDEEKHWNTISANVGDVKAQTDALKDSEDGIRAAAEATSRGYEGKLQRLRDAQTALDRQYDTETKIQQLHKLDDDIAKNRLLGKNIFSSEGRAAAVKAEQEGEQRTQLIRQMGHDKEKQGFQDAITAVERQKQAAAQQAQDQIKAVEASIKGIQREAAAYDEYNRAKQAAIAAYRKQLETVDPGDGASVGVRALGGTIGAQSGLLDQFSLKLREILGDNGLAGLMRLASEAGDGLRTFGGIVGGLVGDLGKLGEALGVDKGIAAAFAGAQAAGQSLMTYLLTTMPGVAQVVGAGFQRITDSISLAIRAFTAGVAGVQAFAPGATDADRTRFAAAASDFQSQLEALRTGKQPTGASGPGALGTRANDSTRPTRTVDRGQPANHVTVGVDPDTGNLTVAMRHMMRTHPEILDIEAGAH